MRIGGAQLLSLAARWNLRFGSLREALAVLACQGQVGVIVQDVAIQEWLQRVDALVSHEDFPQDVEGLVGGSRMNAFLYAAKESLGEAIQSQYGRWYANVGAREVALAQTIRFCARSGLCTSARFGRIASAHPNSLERAQELAADALLAHLAGLDLRDSEWGRPLTELVRQFRARHVEGIRSLRESPPLSSTPNFLFTGSWLGAYVEVTVSGRTGQVTGIVFEVD